MKFCMAWRISRRKLNGGFYLYLNMYYSPFSIKKSEFGLNKVKFKKIFPQNYVV